MKTKLTKKQIIEICSAMSFKLDYDQYSVKDKGWMRFELKEELDEKDLRFIWYKHRSDAQNFSEAANILFKAGQKAFKQKLNQYVEL